MNFELIPTAFAQGAEQTARSTAPMWPMLLALFAVFYFFIIRPQQKKQKDSRSMLESLAKGDRVVTIGGICGTIVNIRDKKNAPEGEDIVVVKVGEGTKLEMLRSSVARTLNKDESAEKAES